MGALGLARADAVVQFVDEEYDPALALAHFLQHGLEPLLKFAAVLGAGDEAAHVQREKRPVLQRSGHVAAHDALRQPFGDGGLATPGSPMSTGLFFDLRESMR